MNRELTLIDANFAEVGRWELNKEKAEVAEGNDQGTVISNRWSVIRPVRDRNAPEEDPSTKGRWFGVADAAGRRR